MRAFSLGLLVGAFVGSAIGAFIGAAYAWSILA